MRKALEYKKREPINGSLVANTIKCTPFLAKSQAFHALGSTNNEGLSSSLPIRIDLLDA